MPRNASRSGVAVLVFFWGAFAFVWSCSRVRPRQAPWPLAPCLAMLAYGWVFRMGLFNFYLSLGLCFGALAMARTRRKRALVAAALLLATAYVAHALPVVWAIGIAAYALAPNDRIPGSDGG